MAGDPTARCRRRRSLTPRPPDVPGCGSQDHRGPREPGTSTSLPITTSARVSWTTGRRRARHRRSRCRRRPGADLDDHDRGAVPLQGAVRLRRAGRDGVRVGVRRDRWADGRLRMTIREHDDERGRHRIVGETATAHRHRSRCRTASANICDATAPALFSMTAPASGSPCRSAQGTPLACSNVTCAGSGGTFLSVSTSSTTGRSAAKAWSHAASTSSGRRPGCR